jgi:uncharacterized protein (DUF362 family)
MMNRRTFLKILAGLGISLVGVGAARQTNLSIEQTTGGGSPLSQVAAPSSGTPTPDPALTVAIVRGDDPAAMVRSAVAMAGGLAQVVYPGATVFLKPNLTIPSPSGKGNVTDSRVLQAAIELCQEAGATKIIVGDGSGDGDSTANMRQAGYEAVLQATGATFVDLNKDEVVVLRPTSPVGLSQYSMDKTAVETPVFISLPVLKVHDLAVVSLSCKNLMGITAKQVYGSPRQQLHDADVQKVICDLVSLRKPDFAIVDGLVGLEGDAPMNGNSVTMNLIVAGRNPVSVDSVGAAIMGYDAQQIEQLALMASKGLGEIDLARLRIMGMPISEVQRKFARTGS